MTAPKVELEKLAKELGVIGHSIRPAYLKKFPICADVMKEFETKNISVPYDIDKRGKKVPVPGTKVGAVIDYNQLQFVKAVQRTEASAQFLKARSSRYLADVFRCYFLSRQADTFQKFFQKDTQAEKRLNSAFSLQTYIRALPVDQK